MFVVSVFKKFNFLFNFFRFAEKLDELTGGNSWKESEDSDENTSDYDFIQITKETENLKLQRMNGNIENLIQTLARCLESQQCRTLNPIFYSMTFTGTKTLSENLHSEIVNSINYLTGE